MKKDLNYIVLILILVLTVSCEKNDVPEPTACFESSLTTAEVGESITFQTCNEADFYSIWTGDEGHDYSKRPEVFTDYEPDKYTRTDNGIAVDESYDYTYDNPGTYTVVWVASNVGDDGEILKQTTAEITITITE